MVLNRKMPGLRRKLQPDLINYRRFKKRYEILELISEAHKTEIYKAYDKKLNKFIALKIIRFDSPAVLLDMPEFIRRWKRMCKYTKRLKHPNILRMLDNGINQRKNFIYYSTPFIAGFSLDDIGQLHKIGFEGRLKIALDLIAAVSYAHKKGVIHRDIKPSNILVDAGGKAYITDFQSARFEASPITKRGMTFGTPSYMSPEQIKGLELDSRSDIFSLGVVYYYLFYGRSAFEGRSSIEISTRIVNEDPFPLTKIDKNFPSDLTTLIGKMLKKDPEERISDYTTISKSLKRFLEKRAN